MILARSLLFHSLYVIWAFLMSFAFLPSLILPFWASRFIGWFWTASVFGLLKATTGVGHRIEGQENIPDGPVIFASKHQSTWETMVFPYLVKDPVTILKRELFLIPFYGWYVKKYGCIGIDRSSGASALRNLLREARTKVAAGRPLIVYPEGTRAPPGETKRFQIGVAALYQDLNIPVVPVALNSGHFWPRRRLIRWPGTITLRFLPPIPPGLNRRAFMERLEGDIKTAQAELDAMAIRSLISPAD
jgi:1-acyl-sn-glycerol-3-phosphate acyltransferase